MADVMFSRKSFSIEKNEEKNKEKNKRKSTEKMWRKFNSNNAMRCLPLDNDPASAEKPTISFIKSIFN